MQLSGYLAVARRWWWTLIVSAWVAGLAGYIVASGLPPTYESQVKVLVGPINTDTDTLKAAGNLVQTYAQVVTTRSVLASAIKEVGINISPDDLGAATRATANDVTRILAIRVQAGDPKQAADLANSLATELESLTSKGLSQPAGLTQIVEFAQPTPDPVAPQVSLIAILAAVAGAIVAIVIVLLLEYFGSTIRTREELASLAGAPALAAVAAPHGDRPEPSDLVVDSAPDSRAASAYRLAAAKIAFGGLDAGVRSFVVSDADWEGESAVVASNLAAALARLGQRVVLIDGAGPGGSLSALHGLTGEIGLSEVLAGEAHPVLPEHAGAAVHVLPGGQARLDIVDPARVRELVDGLTGGDAMVVISTAPIKDAPLTLTFVRSTDGVVLVARRDRAHREDVQFASESVKLVGAPIIGVVLTERAGLLSRSRGRDAGAANRITVPLRLEPGARARRSGSGTAAAVPHAGEPVTAIVSRRTRQSAAADKAGSSTDPLPSS